MSKTIDYDFLVEQALRDVVHKVLISICEKPNIDKFQYYITFDTTHPNVKIPKQLLKQYPKSLTIVLEHQFWDLNVMENSFSVVLSFNSKKLSLEVGFDSIIQFSDPSSDFSLQFSSLNKNSDKINSLSSKDKNKNNITDEIKNNSNKKVSDDSGEIISLEKFRKNKDE